MKKIVIFDMDGTLLNTLEDLTDSTNFALRSMNFPLKTKAEIQSFVGNGITKLIQRAVPQEINEDDFKKCLSIFKKHYEKNMCNKTIPYSGIIEMLKQLKRKGIKTAVVSNKFDSAVKELSKKFFDNLIDFAVGENEAKGIKKKPAPDTIKKVLNKFSLKNSDAIYVGDSDTDILTAKNADITCASVSWGFRTKNFLIENGAKILINSPDEIFEHLSS